MIPVALAVVVAVLPFHDLTAGKGGAAGEALRETVTADLRNAGGGLRVVERDAIENVVRELDLRAKPGALSDPDPASTIKLGRLVGATHVVTGAYQRAGATVRLTARVITVETGEVAGAAKVDGPVGELFRLQDQLTAELTRAVGIRAARRGSLTKRAPMRDWKLVERYGDAVVEADDAKRRAILKEVLAAQPDFRWAAADLDALERRMLRYAAEQQKAEGARARDASATFAAELKRRDPKAIKAAYEKLVDELLMARRHKRILDESERVLALPAGAIDDETRDYAEAFRIATLLVLVRDDEVLRHGERFLATRAGSPLAAQVRGRMELAISRRRRAERGRELAEAQIKRELSDRAKADPCNVWRFYAHHEQWALAVEKLEACRALPAQPAWMPPHKLLRELAWAHYHLGHFRESAKLIAALRALDPSKLGDLAQLENEMPVDD